MFLLPQGRTQIKTKLSRDIAEQRLAEQVEPRRIMPGIFRGTHKYFEGEMSNGHFKINCVPHYKHAFNLVIIGEIQAHDEQTTIDLMIRLDYTVLATMIIGVSILLFAFLCFPMQFFPPRDISSFTQVLINLLKVLLIFYLVVLFSFNFKAYNILDYLHDLFAGK